MSCSVTHFWDCPGQWLGDAASSVAGSALEHMAQAVEQALGTAMASLGTLWTKVGTPDLTGGPTISAVQPGTAGPGAAGITSVLGDVMWVSIVIAVVSLVILGGMMAVRMRRGDGIAAAGRIGLVLAAVVLISGASALVTGLMPAGPSHVGGPVLFLQDSLWWYMSAAAVLSVLIGGARMAWEQRAEPGRDVLKSLMTLIIVAGAGVTVIGLLVQAADGFSTWIIDKSLQCTGTSGTGTCFGQNMGKLLVITTAAGGSLGVLLIIVLGLIAILASVIQMALMVARGGMLVLLAGFLPLSASFTNTETGKGWFRKTVAWTIAFVLYKPAAAIVYGTAFQLVGQINKNGTPLLSVVTGLMLMILALFALPALMRFVTPMVAATAGGAGAAMALGAAAALPTGAKMIGRAASAARSNVGGSSGGGAGSSATSAPTGAAQAGGKHASGGQGAGGPSGSSGSSGSTGKAAAGAGMKGAAKGAAAAGPVGAVVAGVSAARGAIRAAKGAAANVGQAATGESNAGGPHGSS